MTARGAIACASACACALLAVAPGVAHGSHAAFDQASIGATGGNAALPTQFVGASDDGTRVFLRSEERLAGTDGDDEFDLFERAGGVTTQLTLGPSGGNLIDTDPQLRGMSADGKRVFFQIAENLVPGDTDDCLPEDPLPNPCPDVYERSSGGTTTLLSTGPNSNGLYGATFAGASEDGARVFFFTDEPIVASDTDQQQDVYERADGSTTLLSTGGTGGNGSFKASFSGSSQDGSVVIFSTAEQLVGADTDSSTDLYERSGGTTTLVSTGPAGGNGAFVPSYEHASESGTRVFFTTSEQLVAGDTDSALDIYERSGGTTTLVSTGPAGGNGSADAHFKAVSPGGSKVFFETPERLVASDVDSATDVFERSSGGTTLVSTGPAGGNGPSDANFQGASRNGDRVVFATAESMVPGDTDGRRDLYERAGATTTLVSTGPAGGNGAFEAFFSAMSDNGHRIFFETLEPLSSDTDALPDIYERSGGVTTRVSSGTGGGNGAFIAVFLGASRDGARVFFNSAEVLAGTDGDTASDVYVARTTDSYVRPKSAHLVQMSLVPAYRPCTAPNMAHGPPVFGGGAFDGSCSPPVQTSDQLTVATFDANQQPVKSTGKVIVKVTVGTPSTPEDEADVSLHMDMNDVRRHGTLDDYTGQLKVTTRAAITDRENGSVAGDPATVVDIPFEFVANCVATADITIGGECAVDTTADAVLPGAIKEGFRSSWELGRVEVYDGGPDGTASTEPNTLFAVQGIFVP